MAAAPAGASPSVDPKPTASEQPWRWRVLEFLSAYLPLLLMAVLALGTWWLVKNTPVVQRDRAAAPLRHEPDYEMSNFSVQRFGARGPLKAQIDGDSLRHYPDTDTVEIDNVRVRSIGADGRITYASARRGLANGAGTEVQLLGGAQVVSEATPTASAVDFRGEFLHIFLDTERVRSHLPVIVINGDTQVYADGMDYSHLDQLIQFTGRMRASFQPRSPNPPSPTKDPAR